MFILRGLKRLFFFAVFCGLLYLAAHYPVKGRPLYQVVKSYWTSQSFETAWKDIKMFFGGFLKSVGEEIQEDVTEHEKKELDALIEKEVQKKNSP